jgi:hypothetical protein
MKSGIRNGSSQKKSGTGKEIAPQIVQDRSGGSLITSGGRAGRLDKRGQDNWAPQAFGKIGNLLLSPTGAP